jgi:septum formation protein
MVDLVLASGSPRRHELLEMAGISHIVDAVPIDETAEEGESPAAYAARLARAKARVVSTRHPDSWVLGADTVVILENSILGKPSDRDDAKAMLHRLAGRRHEVLTSVAIVRGDDLREATEVASVWMRSADDRFIHEYVESGEPMGKAGAYAAQGLGALLVDRLEGDFFTVMGLPLGKVVEMLDAIEGE